VKPQPRAWLAPVGALFGAAAWLRASLYRRGLLRRQRLRGPVISVGNLSVGGSGKTPVVAWLAERLRDLGQPVAVLSRGYGGSFRGKALVVSEGTGPLVGAEQAGDAPVMLAQRLPGVVVAVGRRRIDAGRLVEARFGARVHVLDDGFQHLALHRDLDLVCLDPADLEDRPLPAGRLREFRSALARADLALLSDTARDPAALGLPADRCVSFRRRIEGVRDGQGRPRPLPDSAWLLSGIARPQRFAADVRALGVRVVGHAAFPDHHRFTQDEVAEVRRRAAEAAAGMLLTTEKDAERLPRVEGTPELGIARLGLEVVDEARLLESVRQVIAGRPL